MSRRLSLLLVTGIVLIGFIQIFVNSILPSADSLVYRLSESTNLSQEAIRKNLSLAPMSVVPTGIARVLQGRNGAILSVLLILLLFMFNCVVLMQGQQRDRTVAIRGKLGLIRISVVAIADHVRRVCREFEEVRDAAVTVAAKKKGLEVVGRIGLTAQSNVKEIAERIQDRVQETVREVLGIEEIAKVEFNVRKFVYKGDEEGDVLGGESSGTPPGLNNG